MSHKYQKGGASDCVIEGPANTVASIHGLSFQQLVVRLPIKIRAGRLWIFLPVLFFICFCLLENLSNGLYICFLALKSYQTVYLSDRNEKLIYLFSAFDDY